MWLQLFFFVFGIHDVIGFFLSGRFLHRWTLCLRFALASLAISLFQLFLDAAQRRNIGVAVKSLAGFLQRGFQQAFDMRRQ